MAMTAPVEADFDTKLLEAMKPKILRYARSRVDSSRAEEVLSDVFHAALLSHRRGNTVTEAWLMTVARNKIVDIWRRSTRGDKLMERLRNECPVFGKDDPEAIAVESGVAITLDRLAERDRTILVRHYVDGVPVGSLADENSVSYSAMESAMARARIAFRRQHLGPIGAS